MLRIIDLRGADPDCLAGGKLARSLPRAAVDVEKATEAVRPVCEDVRQRGAAAVREHTARFDGVDLATTRVPAAALAEAEAELDPAVRAALQRSGPPGPAGPSGPAARPSRSPRSPRAPRSPSGTCRSAGPACTCPAG
jgi:hypothetical protein